VLPPKWDRLCFAKDVAGLAQTCGEISAIKLYWWGAAKMVFAIGIFILVIAATTIIGATVLSLMASSDRNDPFEERSKARDGRASQHNAYPK
jgi:hypothetical protein